MFFAVTIVDFFEGVIVRVDFLHISQFFFGNYVTIGLQIFGEVLSSFCNFPKLKKICIFWK